MQDLTLKYLEKALTCHKEGNITAAKSLYDKVLLSEPENDTILYFNSLISLDLNDQASSIEYLTRAININPSYEYLKLLGDIYFDLPNYEKAADSYRKAAEINTSDFDLVYRLGDSYFSIGNLVEAITFYKLALEINPNIATLYYNIAVIYEKLNKTEEAINYYNQAININPKYLEAYYNIGLLFKNTKKDYQKALSYCLKALELNFNSEKLFLNIGIIYSELGVYDQAINYFSKAIELKPDYADAYNSMGLTFYKAGDTDKAINSYNTALKINPQFVLAYNNLGITYREKKNMEKALSCFESGINASPQHPECNLNLGTTCLMTAKYDLGWEKYEYRFHIAENPPKLLEFSQPRWQGEPLNEKTIYIYYEQGFGDTIMFSRYLSCLINLGAKVLFRPQNELIEIFKENSFGSQIIYDNVTSPSHRFDYNLPLASLARIIKKITNNDCFSPNPYIKPNKDKVHYYKKNFFNHNRFKVGLFWQGNPKVLKNRAIKLKDIHNLFKLDNKSFYSLQKGEGQEQLKEISKNFEIVDLGSTFNDFSDTAAVIENLDLVITIDSAVAHLAGAIGKETWLLLPFVPDWRWGLDSEKSHWYKSISLYRQTEPKQWTSVINNIIKNLEDK